MAAKPKKTTAGRFRVMAGLNYPAGGVNVRAEAGAVVDDLPAESVPWLLEQGYVEPVDDAPGKGDGAKPKGDD